MKLYKVILRFGEAIGERSVDCLAAVHAKFWGAEFSGYRVCRTTFERLRSDAAVRGLAGNVGGEVFSADGDGFRFLSHPYWLVRLDESVPVGEAHFDCKGHLPAVPRGVEVGGFVPHS